MRLEVFPETYDKRELAGANSLKFLVAQQEGSSEKVLRIGKYSLVKHLELLPSDHALIGAGQISLIFDHYDHAKERDEFECRVQWGSMGCADKKGFDRPTLKADADSIIEEVRATFMKWRSQFL